MRSRHSASFKPPSAACCCSSSVMAAASGSGVAPSSPAPSWFSVSPSPPRTTSRARSLPFSIFSPIARNSFTPIDEFRMTSRTSASPSSIRFAISISPSRVSSATEPIFFRYKRTGSKPRPRASSSSAASAGAAAVAVVAAGAAGRLPFICFSFSTISISFSSMSAMTSSSSSDSVMSSGRASFISS